MNPELSGPPPAARLAPRSAATWAPWLQLARRHPAQWFKIERDHRGVAALWQSFAVDGYEFGFSTEHVDDRFGRRLATPFVFFRFVPRPPAVPPSRPAGGLALASGDRVAAFLRAVWVADCIQCDRQFEHAERDTAEQALVDHFETVHEPLASP